jgi:hypothetical protein
MVIQGQFAVRRREGASGCAVAHGSVHRLNAAPRPAFVDVERTLSAAAP